MHKQNKKKRKKPKEQTKNNNNNKTNSKAVSDSRLVSRDQTLDRKVRVWRNAYTAVVALECYGYITAYIVKWV